MKGLTNEEIRGLLDESIYCVVSTVGDDGQPWGSPVFFGFDDDAIYWRSWVESDHSRNLRKQPDAAVCVFDSSQPWGTGKGLYLRGKVVQLEDHEEAQAALSCIDARSPKQMQVEEFLAPNPRRIYRFIPDKAWVNQDGSINGQFIDTRKEIAL